MDTGRELEEAMRELEAKLPQLRRLMADASVPFAVYAEAEAWAKSLLQAVRLTDTMASQLRRVLLGESTEKSAVPEPPPVALDDSHLSPLTEMEAELERVFGLPVDQPEETFAAEEEMTEGKSNQEKVSSAGERTEQEEIEELRKLQQRQQEEPGHPPEGEGPIGGALIGAVPKPKPPSYSPENARTFDEAEELPRNP